VLPILNEGFDLRIGCGNYQEYPDGFLCFIEPREPFIRKLFSRIETTERVGALQEAIDRILSSADGIRDKRWWTHEEFNRAAR
jgi:hypothetical protein